MRCAFVESPVGRLLLAADGGRLEQIVFERGRGPCAPHPEWTVVSAGADEVLALAAAQLEEYFAGTRRAFELPLAPRGTPFQRRVWDALLALAYGETTSYGALACAIGQPQAVRAVGTANGANPLPIVIPCHRVIGADGSLTGYGGSLPVKRWLLALERGDSLFGLPPLDGTDA